MILLLQHWTPDSLDLDHSIRNCLEYLKESFHKNLNTNDEESPPTKLLVFWWKMFMFMLISSFFLSCISHFAQYYQLLLDRNDSEKLRNRLHSQIRSDLTSPITGRLKLPPPTPIRFKVN